MKYLSENSKTMGKILLFMYGITAILLFLLALLVQKAGFGEGAISVGISSVYVFSCLWGGFLAGKVQKVRKFLWGILTGVLYIAVMLGITLIVKKGFDGSFVSFIVNFLLCLGGGMLGGMVS